MRPSHALPTCFAADAREAESYARALPEGPADLLLTDPPYCLLTRRRRDGDPREPKGRKIDREPVVRFASVREYRAFTEAWLPLALRSLRPGGLAVIWTNFLGQEPIRQVAAEHGHGHLWGDFIWAKRTREQRGNETLLRVYEVARVFGMAPPPALTPASLAPVAAVVTGYDDEAEGSEWGDHPHHKPFGALEPLLRAYSRPGDCILNPFAGSGSIPAAALRLDRRIACFEKVPAWAERVTERLAAMPR